MDFATLGQSLQTAFGSRLPAIGGALLILVVGWFVAVVARAGVRRLLQAVRLDDRVTGATEQPVRVTDPVASGVFWIVLLGTLVAMLNALDLGTLSLPLAQLMSDFIGYLPNLVAGVLLALFAWIVAALARRLSARALAATTLDDKLSAQAGMAPMSTSLSNMLFWLLLLLFLPAVLGALELRGILEPIQDMVSRMLAHVPRLVAATVLAAIGWLVARILRGLVTSILSAAGVDRINERIGLDGAVRLSSLAGTLVFVLVFVPTLISALDSAGIEAVSGPASKMLGEFFDAVPNIIAAAAILLLTFYVARFVAEFLAQLLANAGFDAMPAKLGIDATLEGGMRPSVLAGRLAMFFAMLFAVAEAADQLGFDQVSELVATFVRFGGDVLLGGAILLIGFWLANLLYRAIDRGGEGSAWLARVARLAVIGLVLAMGLRAMGVANEIVQLAFGLTLGSLAVAFALAFGLGGREAAGRLAQRWLDESERRRGPPPAP